jgi:predicted ATP-binding protein involved in virulence
MIDEVDAHLHPAWQRELGFWLVRHFPNVQFIVTTHSPIVCQAAEDGRIYHLPTSGVGAPFQLEFDEFERVIRSKPDEILLSPAFGLRHTRSPRAVEARERYSELRAKQLALPELSPEEQLEIDELRTFVDQP